MDNDRFSVPPAAGGHFGSWTTDSFGLPAYEYDCDQDNDPAAASFTTQGPSSLHWHAFGNTRFNVIGTNRGDAQALESSRGLQWLNFYDLKRRCPGAGILYMADGAAGFRSDMYYPGAPRDKYQRVFGAAYFKKKSSTADGLCSDHYIFAPFGDDPALATVVTLTNASDSPKSVQLYEFFGVNLHYLAMAPVYTTANRVHFSPSAPLNAALAATAKLTAPFTDVEEARTAFAAKFRFNVEEKVLSRARIALINPVYTGGRRPDRHKRSLKNYYPDPMFLMASESFAENFFMNADDVLDSAGRFRLPRKISITENIKHPCLCAGGTIELAPGESRSAAFLFGYCDESLIEPLVEKYAGKMVAPQRFLEENMAMVRAAAPALKLPDAPWRADIERETAWHGCYTVNSFLHDEWYGLHYLPQGGPYEYLHGFRGAVRDLALMAMGAIYLNPPLARELILYSFRQMLPGGRLMYSAHGYGMATGAVIHENPSDLQLFLFMALAEYVFFTRDFSIMEEEIVFHGKGGKSASLSEAVIRGINYLFNTIGTGKHGLIRSGDGDWNDGISMFVKNRAAYLKNGESMFDTAMAIYVLPRVAALMRGRGGRMSEEIMCRVADLKAAALKCRNDKWFFRGYDGLGAPIGDRELFLEHHIWFLISEFCNTETISRIIREIREKLDNPSHFGQFVLHPPLNSFLSVLDKGWDVNGGMWFAINFILTWGYSKFDKELGWKSLLKNSMAMKATVDPEIWYGIWSGPDSFNACYADRPGETFFHLPTPCVDFPVMNLNLHAGFISALAKLCGIEPGPDGVSPAPRLPFDTFSLKTPAFSLDVKNGNVEFRNLAEASPVILPK